MSVIVFACPEKFSFDLDAVDEITFLYFTDTILRGISIYLKRGGKLRQLQP